MRWMKNVNLAFYSGWRCAAALHLWCSALLQLDFYISAKYKFGRFHNELTKRWCGVSFNVLNHVTSLSEFSSLSTRKPLLHMYIFVFVIIIGPHSRIYLSASFSSRFVSHSLLSKCIQKSVYIEHFSFRSKCFFYNLRNCTSITKLVCHQKILK